MHRHRILSFKHAFAGIWTALREEPNLKFHFLAALVATFLGLFFQITKEEWLIVILLMGLVMSLELANTAVEQVVDFFTQNLHPGAKKAKDIAAGSVLIASITALIIGSIIFVPYLLELLNL